VENLAPTGILSPDRPAISQSLYRLSYRAHPLHSKCVKKGRAFVYGLNFQLKHVNIQNIESNARNGEDFLSVCEWVVNDKQRD